MTEIDRELQQQVDRLSWYHTQELGGGVVTPGMFDHRAALAHYPLGPDLSGLRCLDIGTMDGFWAFEMERRGADEVVAIDVDDIDVMDWPVLVKPKVSSFAIDETKAHRFELVKATLGSRVERVVCSVYDLGRELGQFDLVFCGDLLLHLKDPITALERMHSVTRGRTVVCTAVMENKRREHRPLVEFDGVGSFTWWVPNTVALQRWMQSAGFTDIGIAEFDLPATSGGTWKGHRGVATGYP
jgi:tRNA (mo5U34)-methyltransferase